METAEHKNHELMLKLDNVADSFNLLNFENFDELFPKIINEMELIHKIKSALIETYGSENLLEFESEANMKARKVEERFAAIVKMFSGEEKRLKKELASSMNKKKLSVYNR